MIEKCVIYSIAEEHQNKMLDFNFSKVDIDAMVSSLDIDKSNNNKLRKTLKKFEKGLFSGGLGRLR